MTSPQGMRQIPGREPRMHTGIDLVGTDKSIYAVSNGTVVISSIITDKTNPSWGFGSRVWIRDANNKIVCYNHLLIRKVAQGQTVKAGDLIGVEGATGDVYPALTGVHLHFEIRDRLGVGYKNFNAYEYIGIPNQCGTYNPVAASPIDYAKLVADKADLEPQTVAYLKAYKFADDLLRKLWDAMS